MQFVDVKTDIAFKIEGKTDVAHKLKALGVGLDIIEQTTGLSRDDIAGLDAPPADDAAR